MAAGDQRPRGPRPGVRKLFWIGLVALSLAALTPLSLYLVGLAVAPEMPAPPAEGNHLPAVLEQALWARFGGSGPVRLEPMSVGRVGRFELCMVGRALLRGNLEQCRSDQRDLVLAGLVSASHLGLRGGDTEPSLREALAHGSTAVWISRHWTAGELLLSHAGTETPGPFGGVDRAARTLFDLPADALLPHQAALLAALWARPEPLDPRADPDRATEARNRVLQQMAANGALDPEALPDLLRRPLDLATEP